MSSGEHSGISNCVLFSTISIEQMNSQIQAIQNEENLLIPGPEQNIQQESNSTQSNENGQKIKSDFFIAPNGKAIPAKYRKYIGTNKRESLLSKAQNSILKNAINQLYRQGSVIGDGGTASVIEFERKTGIQLGKEGNSHMQKGIDMLKYLKRISQINTLSKSDYRLAQSLIKKLEKAIGGKK